MAKRKTIKKGRGRDGTTLPSEVGVAVRATSPATRVCVPVPNRELPGEFATAVQELEASLKMPVWLLVQAHHEQSELNYITEKAKDVLFAAREFGLERNKKIALVIDSPGGDAKAAYQIAALLRRHCGGFTAVIPRYAKSAATLIALGADEILLGEFGELGPLDVQVMNPDREERLSALDEIQSLERLNAFALTALDKAMFMLLNRTGMKIATLLPYVTRFATEMTGPLFGNIDVVRYTQMSRLLKIGEEYARKLLRGRFDGDVADDIARKLVENYPTHGFVIDVDEAKNLGLEPREPSDDQLRILGQMAKHVNGLTAIGRIIERHIP